MEGSQERQRAGRKIIFKSKPRTLKIQYTCTGAHRLIRRDSIVQNKQSNMGTTSFTTFIKTILIFEVHFGPYWPLLFPKQHVTPPLIVLAKPFYSVL